MLLAALAVALLAAAGCQANPVGSATAASPVIASQAIPTQAPASPSSAAAATPAATRTPAPTPFYPGVMKRPTGVTVDGTCEATYKCLGLLSTAKHHTEVFAPGFTFTMPETGWENLAQTGGGVAFLPVAEPGDSINFFRAPQAAKPDGTLLTSVPIDVAAMKTWLTTNPALTVSAPTDVTIGGLHRIPGRSGPSIRQ